MEEKEFIHSVCGGKLKISVDIDSDCGDPKCWCTISYYPKVECKKCNKEVTLY